MAGIVSQLVGNIKPDGRISASFNDQQDLIQRIASVFAPQPIGGLPGIMGGGLLGMLGGGLPGVIGGGLPIAGQPQLGNPAMSLLGGLLGK